MRRHIPPFAKRYTATHALSVCLATLLELTSHSAYGAQDLDLTLPPYSISGQPASDATADPPTSAVGSADADGISNFITAWRARANRVRATQPTWSSPLVTSSGVLEQRFRSDLLQQHSGNGTNTTVLDGGKGLQLIVGDTTEIQFAAAPYYIRSGVPGTGPRNRGSIEPLSGFGDWPFIRVKQRLASAPESEGNYVVSALLQIQAPTGIARLTNNAWIFVPSLALGKGWDALVIQGTVGGILPTSNAYKIGYQVQTNIAFQYHVLPVFWPELEVNWTYYTNGQRGGKNQVFLTPGLVVGRFLLPNDLKFTFGVGYQVAVSPDYIARPLTPAYNHAWLFTARLTF
jgi:hypothetical protein